MTKKTSILNYQIQTIIIRAFNEIGNDLGDMLYDIENMTSNNQRDIKQKNNAIVKELDVILVTLYKYLLLNINVALKSKDMSNYFLHQNPLIL